MNGHSHFKNCTSLEGDIVLPTTRIGGESFLGTKITSIRCDNVVNIDFDAFENCRSLKIAHFGLNLTTIGAQIFLNCSALEAVIIEAETPPTVGSIIFKGASSCPIYVPDASVTAYREASGWSAYADRIYPISEYGVVREYEDITSNYTLEVGQAYGNVGGSIQFTDDTAYQHTKAVISDVSYVMVKAPSQASSLVQYVDGNDKILQIAVTNFPSSLTRYNIGNVEGATHVYITSAAGTMQIWKEIEQ
jgi:hypothetical protein